MKDGSHCCLFFGAAYPECEYIYIREGKGTHTRFKLGLVQTKRAAKSKFMFAEGKTKAPIYVISGGAGQTMTAELVAATHIHR
jgi:hypothetical protein